MLQVALIPFLFQPQAPESPNLKEAVVYEVNLRAFSEQGGFNGVTEGLSRIQSVGANILWLMPIYPVGKVRSAGGLGSPYAVQNYDEVNPEFGTRSDFQKLVREAHRRKMKVILDWVGNHTSWDNPWLKNKDWYTQNAKGEIQIPAGTGWNDVADLNFDSQPMRAAMIRSMLGWLQEGIDGFRCDYADGVPADFWRSAIVTLRAKAKKPLIMLAEGSRRDHHSVGFDLTYGWPAYGAIKDIYAGKLSAKDWTAKGLQDSIPAVRFTSNHDFAAWDGSAVSIFGGQDAAFGAFVVSAFSRGVPLIYDGQEIGWAERIPFFTKSPLDWNSGADQLKRYQQLMSFRAKSAGAKSSEFQAFSTERVIGFVKSDGRERVMILANTSKQANEIAIPSDSQGAWTNALTKGKESFSASRTLDPFQTLVLSRVVR